MKGLTWAVGAIMAMGMLSACAVKPPAGQGDAHQAKVSPKCQSCLEQRDQDLKDEQNAASVCHDFSSTIKDPVDRHTIETQCLDNKKSEVPLNCDGLCRN